MILKRFYEDNLARELSPSQKRYVGYFSGLVTGALILQDRLVYLHAVVYRNPSRGRLLSTTATVGASLEPIAEANSSDNNNNNHEDHNHVQMDTSIYAHPDDLRPLPPDGQQPSVVPPGPESRLFEWSPTQPAPVSVWDWGRLASMDYATAGIDESQQTGPSGSTYRVNGIFPTEQERLCDLTSTIEREMRTGRGDGGADELVGDGSVADTGGTTDWTRGLHSLRTFMEGDGGILLKIYQNLKLMHTTRLLCPNINICVENYVFPIEPVLPLHGDILIACYLRPDISSNLQEIIFRLQFHTCATSSEKLSFFKHDLDEACSGKCFVLIHPVTLYSRLNNMILLGSAIARRE
ncbi:unnamed protein product [Echinostoma caproni]|uniref:C2 tensin-type domain-containing protein n=1 Tax=Echinostoma caproni TaxID=27848 RepID=A0A183B3S6_9TREM|nr:unnamed protein product [Echinostoma caproni]